MEKRTLKLKTKNKHVNTRTKRTKNDSGTSFVYQASVRVYTASVHKGMGRCMIYESSIALHVNRCAR